MHGTFWMYQSGLRAAASNGGGASVSATAGLLAQGLEPFTAVHEAQEYTWNALNAAYRAGKGQMIPNRFFWSTES